MHIIDYVHQYNNSLYHGIISDLEGVIKATWSYEAFDKKITQELPITEEDFLFLWNSIADLDAFRRHFSDDPNSSIDWVNYHFLSITFKVEEQQGHYQIMVPNDEYDPDFTRWLEVLNVPVNNT